MIERKSRVPLLYLWLGVTCSAAILAYLGVHWSYYILPPHERAVDVNHPILRSSGFAGLAAGLAGTVLLFLNLTYLLRKSLASVAWLGQLRSWMSFHVFSGIVGGLLIVLHSALDPHSALGSVAFLGLGVVVATGVVGRFIYAHTPRSLEGKELELSEVHARLAGYRAALEKAGLSYDEFERTFGPPIVHGSDSGIIMSIWTMILGDRRLRAGVNRLKQALAGAPSLKPHADEIVGLAVRLEKERQWIARYQELRGLMRSWRFFHRWFAIVLLAMALFHVVIAARMGNLWVIRNG